LAPSCEMVKLKYTAAAPENASTLRAVESFGRHNRDAGRPDTTETLHITACTSEPERAEQYILVVDDEANVLMTVGASLAKAGFAVQKSANGDDALRMIAGDPQIKLLLTDFAMPGMSGAELISQAAQIRPNLKALMMTGYVTAGGLAQLPPDISILAKPFRRAELLAGVRSLLEERQAA
jgi:CheY-like chemotaxis protein